MARFMTQDESRQRRARAKVSDLNRTHAKVQNCALRKSAALSKSADWQARFFSGRQNDERRANGRFVREIWHENAADRLGQRIRASSRPNIREHASGRRGGDSSGGDDGKRRVCSFSIASAPTPSRVIITASTRCRSPAPRRRPMRRV